MSKVAEVKKANDAITVGVARVSWEDEAKDIIVMTFLPTASHTLEEAKAVVEAHHRLCEGRKTAVLADITGTSIGAAGAAFAALWKKRARLVC